jgi:small subunit ribosomal protein S2
MSRLDELDQLVTSGAINTLSKKMQARHLRDHRKMKRNLDGIRTMERLPGALVVVDPVREKNAVREAKKLEIPVVALADTEANPDDVSVVIPGNDDAMRAIEIVLKHLADAVAEGRANRAARAAIEGEGQALTRGPSRPRARGAPRPADTERPAHEMPLPKPHPAIQEAPGEADKTGAEPAAPAAGP